ncbi:MAG TPA: hypothetical protein VN132_12700, partial [Bdellovibrio sp.]|nr:hypothetical protein [Bdellovibrio sp.]
KLSGTSWWKFDTAATQTAFASTFQGAYKCTLASASADAPSWKSQAFPLLETSDGWEAASSHGSSSIFELKAIDPSQLAGWPTFQNGTYYSGGSDVYVIIKNGNVLKVVKPLETDPNTKATPSTYNCVNAQ